MASILRRGDSYSVRFKYKDHAGRICEGWESFKTKKEAQDRKISVEKELLDGTFLIPDAMTVAEMLYKWLPIQSSKHKWAPKTYTHTVAMIQNLVVPYLGKKQIQKVQTYDLEQFYATLSRTPRGLYKQGVKQTLTDKQKRQFLTGASIREVHATLKTAFSYAVEWGLLLKSPIPREAPKSTSEERAIWDEKTMLAALQTMTDPTLHLAVHLSMILSAACRRDPWLAAGRHRLRCSGWTWDHHGRQELTAHRKGCTGKDRPESDLPHLPRPA